jgi:formate dehydrogenase iron-sulfur subunit
MKAILTDVTKCIGCDKCVAACVAENKLSAEALPARWVRGDGLSAERFTSVVRQGDSYVRKQCRHCLDPACASACPVGALRKTADGPVVYDSSRCLGCRYCMMACPFGIPRYAWGSSVPYVRKCSMCAATRLREGRQPACTEACPEKATVFGERDALLAQARRRLGEAPAAYQPRVYGDTDVGGTSVLYLSPVPLDVDLGARDQGTALPQLTAPAMKAVPPVFVGMGAIVGGVSWIIGRRRKLEGGGGAAAKAHDAPEEKKP